MVLPRPARILRQGCLTLRRLSQTTQAYERAVHKPQVVRGHEQSRQPLDPSFAPLLHDIQLRPANTPKARIRSRHEAEVVPSSSEHTFEGLVIDEMPEEGGSSSRRRGGMLESEEDEGDTHGGAREEQRSPAVVMGSKRVGSVRLPMELEEAVQAAIEGTFLSTHFEATLTPQT
jgi:hypothetical protein